MDTATPTCIFKIYLLLFFISKISSLSSTSISATMFSSQSLANGDVLLSAGQKFALGFFRLGGSNRRYLGIWYHNITEQTVVWVANRETPLNDTSGVVRFDQAGNLVLTRNTTATNDANPLLWSANSSAPAGHVSVEARLLDTGNLAIVRRPTGETVWQSFDYPTNTFLPFMKLGVDRRTGVTRAPTSWKSREDPGTGICSSRIDLTGTPQLILYEGSNPRWRSGPLDGQRWSGVPAEMGKTYNPDEVSETYVVRNESVLSMIALSESCGLQRSTWLESERRWKTVWSVPKDSCDPYGHCGAFGYCNHTRRPDEFECSCLPGFRPRSEQNWNMRNGSAGCVRAGGAVSACGKGEGFLRLGGAKVPDTRVARVDKELSGEACERACRENCSCVAYASWSASGGDARTGCMAWYGDLVDIQVGAGKGRDLFLRVDAATLENARKRTKGRRGSRRVLVVYIGSAVLGMLVLLMICVCVYRRQQIRCHAKRLSRQATFLGSVCEHHNASECPVSSEKTNLRFFTLEEIKCATMNFTNKLGHGGFGDVYMGHLPSGHQIAVKRLSRHSGQGMAELHNEVYMIAKLQHRNLVKVYGCCIEEAQIMLIYEYVPNKSLDRYIFDDSRKSDLDWKTRREIIIGIARGILYLHQDSRLRIVHRDLKASNVLLDEEMNPKISDFGIAKVFGGKQTQGNTERVAGTIGYISPEYARDGLFSMESDVFSFGVLVIEIICGKRNLFAYDHDSFSTLLGYVWDTWKAGRALEIVDDSMRNSVDDYEVLMRCVQVGLLCVQDIAADRPTMSTVVFMLSNETVLPPSKKPTFGINWSGKDSGGLDDTSGATSASKNELTVTDIGPR